MAIETATYVNELNAANPDGAVSQMAEVDNHLRLIKQVLKNTFPSVTGAVSATQTELNYLDVATLGTAENSKVVTVSAGGTVNLSSKAITNANIDSGTLNGITALSLGGSADMTAIETTLAGSATKLATAGAVKGYVDLHRAVPQTAITLTSTTSWTLPTAGGEVYERIDLSWFNLSTSAVVVPLIRIGTGGVLTTTGYDAAVQAGANGSPSTAGFPTIETGVAASNGQGNATLMLVDSATNTWVLTGLNRFSDGSGTEMFMFGGKVALAGPLNIVGFTVSSGTFDAGTAQAYVSRSA